MKFTENVHFVRRNKIWTFQCQLPHFKATQAKKIIKQVKFGVSGYFLDNTWKEWPEFWHADVPRPHSELIDFGLGFRYLFTFLILVPFWLSEISQILLKNAWEKWPELFWYHFDLANQVQFLVYRHFLHGRNGLKFDVLMSPDHL